MCRIGVNGCTGVFYRSVICYHTRLAICVNECLLLYFFVCLSAPKSYNQYLWEIPQYTHTHTHTFMHFFPCYMQITKPPQNSWHYFLHTHTHTHTHTQAYTRANLLTFSCYMKTTKPPQYILHIYLLVEVSQNSDCSRIVNRPRIIWAHFKWREWEKMGKLKSTRWEKRQAKISHSLRRNNFKWSLPRMKPIVPVNKQQVRFLTQTNFMKCLRLYA